MSVPQYGAGKEEVEVVCMEGHSIPWHPLYAQCGLTVSSFKAGPVLCTRRGSAHTHRGPSGSVACRDFGRSKAGAALRGEHLSVFMETLPDCMTHTTRCEPQQ